MGSSEGRNLWLSLIAGVFAAFLLYSYSQENKDALMKKYGSTKVIVVAKEDIPEMSTIYETMLETRSVPKDFMAPNSIDNPEDVVGNVTAIPIKKEQPILRNFLYTPVADTGISMQVAPTKRAVAIPVDEVRGVAKLIRPGDRVDIIAALDSGKGINQRREAFYLMQDVVVLATGVSIVNNLPRLMELDSSGKNVIQTPLTGDTKYSTITVEADLKQAQDLVYILSTSPGNLYFTLRNPNDRQQPLRLPTSTSDSVLGKPVVDISTPTNAPVAPVAPPQMPQRPQNQQQQKRPGGFQRL